MAAGAVAGNAVYAGETVAVPQRKLAVVQVRQSAVGHQIIDSLAASVLYVGRRPGRSRAALPLQGIGIAGTSGHTSGDY